MSTLERRQAARANQRAAAFARFQMVGDAEAMQVVLTEASEDEYARLAFVTALASLAASTASTAFGRDGAMTYFQTVAANSAALSEADDIDDYFS
ncbi:MAG: hypothetical protein IPG94_13415 [Kineosporiaceae bacterium]|nr:hypothetical protein [Kineosporiaceae bacterium]